MRYKHTILILMMVFSFLLTPFNAFAENAEPEGTAEETVTETVSENEAGIDTATEETDIISDGAEETELDTEGAFTQDETAKITVESTLDLSLFYDDFYDFAELLPGYVIVNIETRIIDSYKVQNGTVSADRDPDVVAQNGTGGTEIIAAGVGEAAVTLVLQEYADTAAAVLGGTYTGEPVTIPATEVTVTVQPATLTIMFLAGQSNMEGSCAENTGYQPEASVLCERGQVYSTYSARSNTVAQNITGLANYFAGTSENAASIVAGAINSRDNQAIDGSSLVYPLDALTGNGNGKTGMDSGLAYEWNRLTGEKVWCVNSAWGATSIETWVPGGTSYEKAAVVFGDALNTYNAELQAGHYVAGEKIMFWLQGETDRSMDYGTYYSLFQNSADSFRNALSLDYFGIISVRASFSNTYTTSADLMMTAPRVAQAVLSADSSEYNLYMVSNINEQWVTDTGVSSYFCSRYPDGYVDYPVHSSSGLKAPATVAEVHGDIHYSQAAHNENGIDAARNMYAIVSGTRSGIQAVKWVNSNGIALPEGTTVIDGQQVTTSAISVNSGEAVSLTCVTEPVYMAKEVHLEYDSDAVEWNAQSGAFYFWRGGTVTILAKDSAGNVLHALQVEVSEKVTTPVLKTASNTGEGIKITWTGTATDGYFIYRKTASSSWVRIAETERNENAYYDTDVQEGTSYIYTVRAGYSTGKSGYDKTGITCVMLRTPVLTSAGYASGGIAVKWSGVTGAQSYNIYRKTETTEWSRVGSASGTTYTDTSAQNGVWYTYTVRAVNNGKLSSFDPAGVSGIRTATPVLSSAVNSDDGIRIVWKASAGAESYRIYRKTSGSGWVRIDATEETVYLDTDAEYGVTYTYTVRAVNDGVSTSGYNASGISCTRLERPELVSAMGSGSTIKISWDAVTGAASYNVYRKSADSNWSRIATVNGKTGYNDSDAKAGMEYTYTVRAVKNGSLSTYDPTGLTAIRLATPGLTSATVTAQGVLVSWKAVSGAEKYRVYHKAGSGSWQFLTETSDLFFEDLDVQTGTKYTYTVRATNGGNISGYNATGVSATFVAQPQLLGAAVNDSGTGITVSWTMVDSATGYNVYRKTENGSWSRLKSVSGQSVTSFCDTTAAKGTVYIYTVRAVYNSSLSSFDRTGVSAVR